MSKQSLILPAICVLGFLLFAANIGGYGLWPADEPRFGQVAREMIESGNYLSPHVNGQPYREKPPLLFWSIAAASLPFGDVTEFSARLPSVLAAVFTLVCTFYLARNLFGGTTALLAVVVLATSTRFWWEARTVQTDMLLTACLTLALWMFWLWHKGQRRRYLVLFYLAVALGLYAKGPPALVFPLLPIFTFYWKRKPERRKTHWILGGLAAGALAALWLIPARMHVAGVGVDAVQTAIGGNLFRQTIGRFILGVSHAQPPWYYLESLPVDLMPWTLILPFTLIFIWRNRKTLSTEDRFLLSWILPAFVFFSISLGKRALYLLPIFPPVAILLAKSLIELSGGAHPTWSKRSAGVWAAVLALLALVPAALPFTEYAEAWSMGLLAFSISAGCMALGVFYMAWKTEGRNLAGIIAAPMAILEILAASFLFPAIDPYKSAKAFCAPLRTLSEKGQDYALFSLAFSREEYVFYARHFHEPLLIDVLPMELPAGHEEQDPIALQVRLRKAVTRAAREVPVESDDGLSTEELARIAEAIEQACVEKDIAPALVEAFKQALAPELAVLEEAVGRPAFIIVQDQDYRWLMALTPALRGYPILQQASVGSRDVLLLGNDAGVELLAR